MTDQERNAMQMALEALESCDVDYDSEENPYNTFDAEDVSEAIEALRQALAQPEQEPTVPDNMQDWANLDGDIVWHLIDRHADNWADIQKMMDEFVAAKIASAHLKHEWVSLTDEEIEYIWGVTPPDYENFFEFPRAIEAKLKEKNNG